MAINMAAAAINKLLENKLLANQLTCIICKRTRTHKNSQFTTITKNSQQRMSIEDKALVKKRFNWENLYLYGPILEVEGTSQFRTGPKGLFTSNLKLGDLRRFVLNKTQVETALENLSSQAVDTESLFNEFDESLAPTAPILFPFTVNSNDKFRNEQYIKTKAVDILHKATEYNFLTQNLPSVSNILQKTMSCNDIMVEQQEILSAVSQCGWHNFYKHMRDMFDIEIAIREYMKLFFSPVKRNVRLPTNITQHWNSMLPFLYSLSEVKLNEKIIHPYLNYSGITDCIAVWQNQLVLIEILVPCNEASIMRKLKESPIRAAAYAGALNADPTNAFEITEVLLIIPSEKKTLATVHNFDKDKVLALWNLWLDRLHRYWKIRCEKPEANYINISYK